MTLRVHKVARPLPEPPRTPRDAKTGRLRKRDRLGRLLEEWLAEVKLRYTIGGE
ncbi:MAG TPA: hypothetical protein VMJ92_01680 [Candidatus Limnocylindrales bacterium]|nr:hypothetical protein [Candidatus Limnocylindrales bacterium]